MTRRIVYVAYGDKAITEAKASVATLYQHNKVEVSIVSNEMIGGAQVINFDNPGAGTRWAKLNIDMLVDADIIGYLDADTRVRGDISPAFEMVESGLDLVIAPSVNQGGDTLKHIEEEERNFTFDFIGNPWPLQLQAGVFIFSRDRCLKLFSAWREEWQRYGDQDQAALLRALHREPVRVGLLGKCWNSDTGAIISHLFGRARN